MNDRLLLVAALESSFIKCRHCSYWIRWPISILSCKLYFFHWQWVRIFFLVVPAPFLFSLNGMLVWTFCSLMPVEFRRDSWISTLRTWDRAALWDRKENSQSRSTCSVFMLFPPCCHALPAGSCCSSSWHCQVTLSRRLRLPSTRLREALTSPYCHVPQHTPRLGSGTCVGTALTRVEEPTGLHGGGPKHGMALSSGPVVCASYTEICMQQGGKMHFFKLEKFLNRLYSCQVRMGERSTWRNSVASSSSLKVQGHWLSHFVHPNPQNKLNLGILLLTDVFL